jgi:hypothetical protein
MSSKWIVRISVTLAILAVGALVVAGLAVFSLAPSAEASNAAPAAQAETPRLQAQPAISRSITVVGEGKARVRPDTAQTNIGVEVVADSVQEASSQTEETMNAVMQALRDLGVPENDMQTSGYSVWVERPYGPEGPQPDAAPLYHVSNSLSVTIRDLDNIGSILDAAIEAGANNIFGVTFTVADPSSFQSEARQEAVENARAKAEELAQFNNVTVGELLTISEVIQGGAVPLFSGAAAEGLGGGGGPISPGELEITVQLQVTYALQ